MKEYKMNLQLFNKLGVCARAAIVLCVSMTMASADALDAIKAAGQINVGIFTDFPPFASSSADMSIKGYDVDVAEYIADKLGVELNLVSITGQNRTDRAGRRTPCLDDSGKPARLVIFQPFKYLTEYFFIYCLHICSRNNQRQKLPFEALHKPSVTYCLTFSVLVHQLWQDSSYT
jgi:ABC-type amino acid transport substrate-binding protein